MSSRKRISRRRSFRKEPVKWLGSTTKENNYLRFEFGSVVAAVGDFVLVLNADALEPDTVDGSDVAKILRLYESDTNAEDPYRAVVQWYSRVRELPKKTALQLEGCPELCPEAEVVEDTRSFDDDISLETVFRSCKVVFLPPSRDPREAAREGGPAPLFVCRFRLVPRARTSFALEPVSAVDKGGNLKTLRRKIFPCDEDSTHDSPEKKKLLSPDRITGLQSASSDSGDSGDELIKSSSHSKRRRRRLSRSSPGSSSRSAGVAPGTHQSSAGKTGHGLRGPVAEAGGGRREERSTPSVGKKRSPGSRQARRALGLDFELRQRRVTDSDEDSDSDDVTKQSTPARKGSKAASRDHTPGMPQRKCSVSTPSTVLEEARSRLHVSAVPQELPCREEEFRSICQFLRSKVLDSVGGCMYISGVPGTGKTATVREVLGYLRGAVRAGELPQFKLVEVNGMQLTRPSQVYAEILLQLTGQKLKAEQAQQILEKRFKTPAPRRTMTLLVVDELDLLCTRRQDVVYNLLDWPNYSTAHLVVITIANTMDLPERSFINRVNSRMGLTRITFQPYTYVQLQKIVMSRLQGLDAFDPDAVQLVARKVAAVSGDARRALDMCRRATEISSSCSETVSMDHVSQVLQEMITSPKIQAIRSCSVLEQAFLRATAAEVSRTGVEETVFSQVYQQLCTLCLIDNLTRPSVSEAFGLCARLGACRLLLTEHARASSYQRIILNVSVDDVHYATSRQDIAAA
ncbi:origin recognition complex subunit 1 isoform X2 [Bacillus rossius redtenbacheri]|uniref:origin recognition complex subunit 1 isoform X2 n=1 Tax=Bacillus rossius redtenbacheri TaxID=93214 RepID=UPI002FDDC19D